MGFGGAGSWTGTGTGTVGSSVRAFLLDDDSTAGNISWFSGGPVGVIGALGSTDVALDAGALAFGGIGPGTGAVAVFVDAVISDDGPTALNVARWRPGWGNRGPVGMFDPLGPIGTALGPDPRDLSVIPVLSALGSVGTPGRGAGLRTIPIGVLLC